MLVGNAEAERVFSVQNRIKTKLRAQLDLVTLDRLIRISYAKVPIEEFDFNEALEDFLQQPRRL